MPRHAPAGLLFACTLAGCTTMPHARPTLAGEWTPERAELGGHTFPIANFGGATLRLTADRYEFAGDTGTYAVVGTAAPGAMDIRGQEGPNAGRTIRARYALAGDQLTISYQLGPGERPSALTSPADSQVLLVRYQRAP